MEVHEGRGGTRDPEHEPLITIHILAKEIQFSSEQTIQYSKATIGQILMCCTVCHVLPKTPDIVNGLLQIFYESP
jgi:hypothetical protein